MFLCIIDSNYDRGVVISDNPGDFFLTHDTSVSTNLNFYRLMAELLTHIDTYIYIEYTTIDNKGRKIMYS